jgi:hypothetical protein
MGLGFVGQVKTHTCRTREPHETHRNVGKLTFNLAGSSRSPPVSKLWKQSAKRGCQFSWLSGSWAAEAVIEVLAVNDSRRLNAGARDGQLYGGPARAQLAAVGMHGL